MKKNGKLFISTVNESDFISSVWDPYAYKHNNQTCTLLHFVNVQKPKTKPNHLFPVIYEAIEYRDIPHGNYLSFSLKKELERVSSTSPIVGEGQLLFGTMRAYLGNALVTPLHNWLAKECSVYFGVKSEFVVLSPYDHLPYFWLAYLRSKYFLENLPLGSGGTRPRLHPEALSQTPVIVPCLEERAKIHNELKILAEREWLNCLKTESIYNFFDFTH